MRALICDDEPLVRSELAYTLLRVDADCIIAEASNALEALALLHQNRYDVLFLDVRMPGLSGLDAMQLLSKLRDAPQIVFVSAYEDHALAAFEHAAADYLLKPVNEARLARTVERIRERIGNRSVNQATGVAKLPVESNGGTRLVRITDIRFLRADDRAVSVFLREECVRFRGSLAECASRLSGLHFVRVHRSFFVNLDHIVEINASFAGTYVLRVDDRARSEVPVSRNYARSIRSVLDL